MLHLGKVAVFMHRRGRAYKFPDAESAEIEGTGSGDLESSARNRCDEMPSMRRSDEAADNRGETSGLRQMPERDDGSGRMPGRHRQADGLKPWQYKHQQRRIRALERRVARLRARAPKDESTSDARFRNRQTLMKLHAAEAELARLSGE
jgi:hypothetical protein